MTYLFPIHSRSQLAFAGNKARSLFQLRKGNVRIPSTWFISWKAYAAYLAEDENLEAQLLAEIQRQLQPDRTYAVRSSANVEDSIETSFAGQFDTVLNVIGHVELLSAVKAVWHQSRSPGVQAYLLEQGVQIEDLKMGIILQEMVQPVLSGVAFSKNPITGSYEIIVEAVKGSGEQLVQAGVTPLRWVQKWGTFLEQPEPQEDIPSTVIEEIIAETKRMAKKMRQPIDMEWVWDGQQLYFVQMREITTLDIPIYSNRISKEFFPGLIKPLIWSINTPLVDGAWVNLFTEMIGPNDIDPMGLAGIFYHRAYFNMGAMGDIFEVLGIPRESLELMQGLEIEGPEKPSFKPTMKTISLMPRLLGFLLRKRHFGRQAETGIHEVESHYQRFNQLPLSDLSMAQLQEQIDGLYQAVQSGAYFNITVPLLANLFHRLLRSMVERSGVNPDQVALTANMPEMDALDPTVQLRNLAQIIRNAADGSDKQLKKYGFAAIVNRMVDDDIRQGTIEFIKDFGHFSDSGNDFSQPPWRENPELVVTMILNTNSANPSGSTQHQALDQASFPLRRRILLKWIQREAGRYQYLRTYISSVYTFGYGLFRKFYLEAARRFVGRDWIDTEQDIFFLKAGEIQEILTTELPMKDMKQLIANRKADLEADRDQLVPEMIYGDTPVPLASVSGQKLTGVATSHGTFTGIARVLMGLEEIDKIHAGEVLVVPYSDVGWTPLFTKAGAVVAESGGLLSHSSIIAREYKIPAVVSVSQACQRLDGKQVTVNGYTGEVTIHS